MKFILNEYNLFSPKIEKQLDIMCITDIHSNVEKLKLISKIIKKLQIKIVLISGDLTDVLADERNEELLVVLKDISKHSYIYIVKGNHDIMKERTKKKGNITLQNKFYNKLSSLDNVKVFNNDIDGVSLNRNINLTSLTLPMEWYVKKERFNNFNKYINKDIGIDNKKFNILLSHTPKPFIKDDLIRKDMKFLSDMNLILCGHMHAGLKPLCLRRNNNHKGLIGPYKTIFPKEAFGYYNNDDSSLIISGGVTKISYLRLGKKVTKFFDNMFASELELIHLKSGKKHHLELSNSIRIKKEQI